MPIGLEPISPKRPRFHLSELAVADPARHPGDPGPAPPALRRHKYTPSPLPSASSSSSSPQYSVLGSPGAVIMLSAALCVYVPFLLFCWVFFPIPPNAGRREEEGCHLSPPCCPRTSQLPVRRMSWTTPPPVPSSFSRTSTLLYPGFKSRLPIPCKSPPSIRVATPSSLPSAPALGASPSVRLDERRAARDARPRPWSDRSTWAPVKPRSERPSPAQLCLLCPRRLFDRR